LTLACTSLCHVRNVHNIRNLEIDRARFFACSCRWDHRRLQRLISRAEVFIACLLGLSGLSIYNTVELNVLIFVTFTKYSGL
jgi:hypothetical protein